MMQLSKLVRSLCLSKRGPVILVPPVVAGVVVIVMEISVEFSPIPGLWLRNFDRGGQKVGIRLGESH